MDGYENRRQEVSKIEWDDFLKFMCLAGETLFSYLGSISNHVPWSGMQSMRVRR